MSLSSADGPAITMATIPNRKSFSDVSKLPSYTTALPGIAELLNKMVAKGDSKGRGSERTAFDGSKPAPVSIQDYLIRMCKYGYCSHEVFICMVIYLGRIRAKVGTTFTSCNIHRLLLTSFVVAAKLRDDTYYSNKYYASIGGVSLQDMNKMEQQFLTCTGWELHISKKEYDQYFAAMHASTSSTSAAAASSAASSAAASASSATTSNGLSSAASHATSGGAASPAFAAKAGGGAPAASSHGSQTHAAASPQVGQQRERGQSSAGMTARSALRHALQKVSPSAYGGQREQQSQQASSSPSHEDDQTQRRSRRLSLSAMRDLKSGVSSEGHPVAATHSHSDSLSLHVPDQSSSAFVSC